MTKTINIKRTQPPKGLIAQQNGWQLSTYRQDGTLYINTYPMDMEMDLPVIQKFVTEFLADCWKTGDQPESVPVTVSPIYRPEPHIIYNEEELYDYGAWFADRY